MGLWIPHHINSCCCSRNQCYIEYNHWKCTNWTMTIWVVISYWVIKCIRVAIQRLRVCKPRYNSIRLDEVVNIRRIPPHQTLTKKAGLHYHPAFPRSATSSMYGDVIPSMDLDSSIAYIQPIRRQFSKIHWFFKMTNENSTLDVFGG
jgi:hypothetical protein